MKGVQSKAHTHTNFSQKFIGSSQICMATQSNCRSSQNVVCGCGCGCDCGCDCGCVDYYDSIMRVLVL